MYQTHIGKTRKYPTHKGISQKSHAHKSLHKIKSVLARLVLLFILFTFTAGVPVYANAAEPPAIVILVPDAPSDLVVSIYFDDAVKFVEGSKTHNRIEAQIKFFWRDLPENTDYVFEVRYGGERFEVTLDAPMKSYHATYTLNLDSKELIYGETLMRNVTLIGLRVGATLLIEGAIFWLMGFREKKTWILLLILNLLTQGVLNFMLSTNPVTASYVIFGLIFGEIFVFIVEWIVVLGLIKEHSEPKRFVAVGLANFASLVLGGYLISILPV